MMNERIKELAEQAGMEDYPTEGVNALYGDVTIQKFAEAIIRECCTALQPALRDMISRGQGRDLILEHFGFMFDRKIKHLDQQLAEQEPGWICYKCGVDRIRDVCPKGDSAVLTGECPMTATAQTGVGE